MTTTPTDTPPTDTPQPEPQVEPQVGVLLFEFADPEELLEFLHDSGSPPPPAPPIAPRWRTGGGRSRDDRFWRIVGWLFFMLLAFAVGGLLGEIGRRLLGPIGHTEE